MQTIEMTIRAASVKGVLVNASNQQIATPPAITRGMRASLVLKLVSDTGRPLTGLDHYAAWDFAIAHDWDTATPCQIHVGEGIEVEGNQVTIPLLETNTAELKEALGTRESGLFGCELAGYEAGETTPAFLVQFDITVRNRRHTSESADPLPVDESAYEAAQIRALFSAKLAVQLSDDGEMWYEAPPSGAAPETARWFRVRNAAAGRDWSDAIPLLGGGDAAFPAWREGETLAAGRNAVAPAVNGTALGTGAQARGPGSATALGADTAATDNFTVAVGNYGTRATQPYAAAFGAGAYADGESAVQLGTGANGSPGTLQFRDYRVLEQDGKIPIARLPALPGLETLDPSEIANAESMTFARLCADVAILVKSLKNLNA